MALGNKSIDWAMGELLAFGTLLDEGSSIRLSGQDSQRGTFTQRHAVWIDQVSGASYSPLEEVCKHGAHIEIYNSILSEFAALGFEYGYTLADPQSLVLWEAQFGDFANGAQVMIDQYITSAEQKWLRSSGIVMLLPHGYEGQGAEHSSARIERFLQLAASLNMQIVYPTNPAQYFHVLRKQIKQPFRCPLVIFTPKGLLRHPKCLSSLQDLSDGQFATIIEDKNITAKRLLLCSGRIYYDLSSVKEKQGEKDTAILRIEQLYPFPNRHLEN